MTEDLPLEIWLIILSYLPPGYVGRLFGVSRVLLELGLDERYREVQFSQINPAMFRTLEQMQNPYISPRVRRFRIRPLFLPEAEKVTLEEELRAGVKIKPILAPLLKRLVSFRFNAFAAENPIVSTVAYNSKSEKKIKEVFDVAKLSLVKCKNLDALSIQLDDLFVTPTFHKLISFLWPCVGANLRTLSFEVTFEKLVIVMGTIQNPNNLLPRLEFLNITFARNLRSIIEYTSWLPLARRNMPPFIVALKQSLKRLTVTIPPLFMYLKFFFDGVNQSLNNITTFQLYMDLSPTTMPLRLESLAEFIEANQNSLEHLHIDIHHSRRSTESVDELGLKTLVFPRLQKLSFDMPGSSVWPLRSNLDSFANPNFVVSIPKLSTLVLHTFNSFDEFRKVVDEVSAVSSLQTLHLGINILTACDIRLLAEKLPQLQRLQLRILFIGSEDYLNEEALASFAVALSSERNKHKEVFDNWNLRFLRVTEPLCDDLENHPSIRVMETIALYIPRLEMLDKSFHCLCPE